MVDVPPRELSQLIGSIYDCALDPARWDQTLIDIKDALDCHSAVLALIDARRHRFLIYRAAGISQQWQERHAKYVADIDALLSRGAHPPPRDGTVVLSRLLTGPDYDASPYVQDYLKPQGLVDLLHLVLMHEPSRVAGLGVARHERQGIITDHEIALGGLLLPHVRRAVMISDALDGRTIERARMTEALDALRCAVLMTDECGTILHANASAERMLRDGGLVQNSGGILQAKAAPAAAELQDTIRLATLDEAAIGKTGLAVRLTEPDAPAVFAHVLPLTGSELRTRLQPTAVAAVFIGAAPDEQDGADVGRS